MRPRKQTMYGGQLPASRHRLRTLPKTQEFAGVVAAALVGIGLNSTLLILVVGSQYPYSRWLLAGWMGDWPISLLLLLTCLAH